MLAFEPRGQLLELVLAAGDQDAIEAVSRKQKGELVANATRGARDEGRLAHENTFSPARTGTGSQFSRGPSGPPQRASEAQDGLKPKLKATWRPGEPAVTS